MSIQITDDDWKPPVEDWGKVEEEVYKLVFAQAKDRFNESMSVTEDITNKSQKLLIGYASFVAAAFSASFKVTLPSWIVVTAIVLYVIDIIAILYLLRNKYIPFRGDMPAESFVPNVNEPQLCKAKEEQIKLIYYHALKRYNRKTIWLDTANEKRATIFQYTFLFSALLFVSTVIYIVYSIFRP